LLIIETFACEAATLWKNNKQTFQLQHLEMSLIREIHFLAGMLWIY